MTSQSFFDGRAVMNHGDSRDVLRSLPDASIDAVVTDPPYALVSIVKRFGGADAAPGQDARGEAGPYSRASAGFMGQTWDTGETAFAVTFWAEVLRILKPGGHIVAFGGTRTYHRLAVAIEDAGFEIRDQLGWLYGTGFPKAHDVAKGIDKTAGSDADGCTAAKSAKWKGWKTAIKPAWEPIALARKPLIGTVVENVLLYGAGALNVGACRVPRPDSVPIFDRRGEAAANVYGDGLNGSNRTGEASDGGFPANVLHDASPEVLAAFGAYGEDVWRFFYSAKANKRDRAGSKHPTVKPVDLMRWLCRLVTPSGGLILEPFAGSGTTLQAGLEEGFRVIGVEREAAFYSDCCRRLDGLSGKPTPRLVKPRKPRLVAPGGAILQPSFFEVAA